MNKVVARFADGRIVKGMTTDFSVGSDTFHIAAPIPDPGWMRTEIPVGELKALFFVRDFDGDPEHVERPSFDSAPPTGERRVQVTFADGEILLGNTSCYQDAHPGFFLVPLDAGSNNERCYVVDAATREVYFV